MVVLSGKPRQPAHRLAGDGSWPSASGSAGSSSLCITVQCSMKSGQHRLKMFSVRAENQFFLREEDASLAAPMYIANASHQVRLYHISMDLEQDLTVPSNGCSTGVINYR